MVTGLMGKQYRSGEVIFRQGDLGDCMYVIHQGQVEVVQRKDEKEFCLATLGQGDFFGEMALFEPDRRPFTVRALDDTTVLTLDKKSFLQRIHEDPSLAYRLLKRMSRRIRELESALVRLGSKSAEFHA